MLFTAANEDTSSLCILLNPDVEERFTFSCGAFTLVEHMCEDEEAQRCRIMKLFAEGNRELQSTARVTAFELVEDESCGRLRIMKHHMREYHEMCLVAELAKHGCDEGARWHASGACALPLIHESPPQPVDESWRRLPSMVGYDSSPMNPEHYTFASVSGKLASLTCDQDDLSSRRWTAETTCRSRIEGDEDEARRRLLNEHRLLVAGLQDIEDTVVDDFRALLLKRLPMDERSAFLQAPTLHEEQHTRRVICLYEDVFFHRLIIESTAVIRSIALRVDCEASAREMCQRRHNEQQEIMMSRRLTTQGRDRFLVWRRWLARSKNIVRRKIDAPQRASQLSAELQRRYCRNWFEATVSPLYGQRIAALCDVAFTEALVIVIREEEERQRNAIAVDEEDMRHFAEDSFLADGDAARSTAREHAIQDLEARSVESHRLLALTRWYSIVRERGLTAKSEWLGHATEHALLQRYFQKFLASPPTARATREWRQHTSRVMEASSLVERGDLMEEEARSRLALDEAIAWIGIDDPHQQYVVSMCQALQTARVCKLQQKNQTVLQRSHWKRWFSNTLYRRPAARAMSLCSKNSTLLVSQYFNNLRRVAAPRVMISRAVLSEASSCLRVAFNEVVEAIKRIQMEELEDRHALQIKAILHRRSSVGVGRPNSVLQMESRMLQCVLLRYFCRWVQRAVQRLQRAEVVRRVMLLADARQRDLLSRYVQAWYKHAHSTVATRGTGALHTSEERERSALLLVECDERVTLVNAWPDACLKALACARDGQAVKLQGKNRVILLERYCSSWNRKVSRAMHRKRQIPAVDAMLVRNTMLRVWRLWANGARSSRLLGHLSSIRVAADQRLRRKYYLRLAPRMVRLAKVSRARSNLEEAQRAARLLMAADATTHRPAARLAPIRVANVPNENL